MATLSLRLNVSASPNVHHPTARWMKPWCATGALAWSLTAGSEAKLGIQRMIIYYIYIYIIYNIWQIDYNHLQPIDYNRIQSINTIDGHLIRSPSKLWTTWTSHKRVATLATLHRKKMQRMKNNQNIYN